MKLSDGIRKQLGVEDDGPDVRVMRNYGGPRRILCWLGFHDKDEYTPDGGDRTYSVDICRCCGRVIYVSSVEDQVEYEED